jgi:fructokinase
MKPPRKQSPTVVCFGEALWDILPRGIFLGGAPLNVAYHLSRLGLDALLVSAVGRDFLGDEALRRINNWGLRDDFVIRRRRRSTGKVRASLDAAGAARYEIAERVAWDHVAVPRTLRARPAPAAIVYGTLAMRGSANRVAAMDLLTRWPETLRVLDLNLRSPFDRGVGVRFALGHAQLIKLNAEELARLSGKPVGSETQLRSAAQKVAAAHGIAHVCVTAGARGAGVLWSDQWFWESGRPVAVRDTIGAGDAVLAAFLAALFKRKATPQTALCSACRHGEFVAACDGATPPYSCDANGRPRPEPSTPLSRGNER